MSPRHPTARKTTKPRKAKPVESSGKLRIIGGRWRRRKLEFPAIHGLRPTPDRIRETLFNWLQAELTGARVLDAFCGSGALGLESLSRGASAACFVDSHPAVISALEKNIALLEAESAQIALQCTQFAHWLSQALPGSFDIAFVDPPYADRLLDSSLAGLLDSAALSPGGLVYFEHPAEQAPELPGNLHLFRELEAGNNRYCLARLAD